MPESTLLQQACTSLGAENRDSSFGHKDNMQVLQRDLQQAKQTQDYSSSNDPLEQLDKIEVVQQSDSAVHFIADEEVSADNNISCISIGHHPIQLLEKFEENMNESQSSKNKHKHSPNAVENFDEKSSAGRDEESDKKPKDGSLSPMSNRSRLEKNPILKLPRFDLHESLRLTLPQSVIDRCSFYSVVNGVNKAVQEMAAEDQDGAIEDTQDEDSALVRAVNGPNKKMSNRRDGPQVELAVLDEERFLLAVIENRSEDEMEIRACPSTFAEAIGEIEPGVSSESTLSSIQSDNPLSVLAASRTQLWKPSRSWWEAKSGKNPWIEPKNHNKRWRYLWPLIHYHKFLAKCIKKLKRNNIDVKTSMNPVPAFLREEVCAVSDHLAATSKFTSEDWMNALPNFNGWTDQNKEKQKALQNLVQLIPMRSLTEPADVDSPLLRDQIDICFLKAMAAARDQIENGVFDMKGYDEKSVNSNNMGSNKSFATKSNSSRPPRHGGIKVPRSTRSANSQRMQSNKQWRLPRHNNRMYGGYHHDHSMMMPLHHMPPGYYPPQFNPGYHGGFIPNPYIPPSVNNTICGWNNGYGGNDYSNLNTSMSTNYDYYQGNYFDPSMEHEASFNIKCDDSVASLASHNNFEGSQFIHDVPGQNFTQLQENSIVHSTNASFDEASLNPPEPHNQQTPSKYPSANNFGTPASPSWAHLNTVPGITTPVAHHGHHNMISHENHINSGARGNQNFMQAKPLLINHNLNYYPPQVGGNAIPASPATQFAMSHHSNSHNNAYYVNGYARGNNVHHLQNQVEGIEENDGQTLTEETSSETTSDTEN